MATVSVSLSIQCSLFTLHIQIGMAVMTSSAPPITYVRNDYDLITNNVTPSLHPDANSTNEGAQPPEGCVVIPLSTLTPWLNPNDLVSYETQMGFRKFVNVYMLTILILVCVPSNAVNMVVFWRLGIRERINVCLFCLSFADLMIVLCHFLWNLDGLWALFSGSPPSLTVMKAFVNNMVHSLAGFIYISGFLSTLVALERCLCVVSPLKAQSIISTRTTAIVVGVGHVIIMAGHYVIATRFYVACVYDPLTGLTADVFYLSEFYLQNKALVDLMDGIVFGILLPGIYVTGILVSTIVTVLKLRKMAEWREKSSSSSSTSSSSTKDVTLTRMLVGTSVLFVALNTPPLAFHVAIPLVPLPGPSGAYYNTYRLFLYMQQLLTYLNSSVNFFVYYRYGTKFRREVQALSCLGVVFRLGGGGGGGGGAGAGGGAGKRKRGSEVDSMTMTTSADKS